MIYATAAYKEMWDQAPSFFEEAQLKGTIREIIATGDMAIVDMKFEFTDKNGNLLPYPPAEE